MDRHQLLTIAITAVISVTAKEVLTWAVARAKKIAATETTKQNARQILSRNNLRMIVSALLFFGSAFTLIEICIYDTKPITRWVIVKLAFYTIGAVGWCVFLISNIGIAVLEYRDRRRERSRENSN